MRLFVVRHGETLWNAGKLLQGLSDIELAPIGCELAKKTGIELSNVEFHRIYTSPLLRAYHTAECIVKENQVNSEVLIIKDPRIIEMSFGIYEGFCYSEEGYNMPDMNFKNFFQNSGDYERPEGGESFQEVIERVGAFLDELKSDASLEDKNILITSHGAAIRGMINYIQHNPVENYWGQGVPNNCEVIMIEKVQNELVIV